jgi:hypothetical protein
LYGFNIEYPPFVALKYFWKTVEHDFRPLLAFVYTVNHDDLLAKSISVVCKSEIGERVPVENFENNIEKYYPKRFSPKTRKSISQNIASSWKQAGFIEGKVKNIRVQPNINYQVACFAFLSDKIWSIDSLRFIRCILVNGQLKLKDEYSVLQIHNSLPYRACASTMIFP